MTVTVEWSERVAVLDGERTPACAYITREAGRDKLDRGWWAENRWVQWFCGGFSGEVGGLRILWVLSGRPGFACLAGERRGGDSWTAASDLGRPPSSRW